VKTVLTPVTQAGGAMKLASRQRLVALATLVVLIAVVGVGPATAQARDVEVTTPYPRVAVEPGERVTLDLDVRSEPAGQVDLTVTSAPEGWDTSLRGGGFVVGGVFAQPDESPQVQLETAVPAEVEEGAYTVEVTATGEGGGRDALTVELLVEEAVAGEPTLSAEFPTLQGSSDTTFSYDLQLENPSPREQTFALEASGPEGWQVTANPAGEQAASTLTVGPGQTERLGVEATPPPEVSAGTYPIEVRATGGEQAIGTELTAEVTGTYDLTLTTPDERLSTEVSAGETTEMQMVVRNGGSAPLQDVQLQASPPSGWEATFSPGTIDGLPPGETAQVALSITPSEDAVVGDYRVTTSANASQTSDSVEVRTTVETSGAWGVVGVGLIVAALGALGWVFRAFGRR
jgi:uncharacterized membrane protein